MSEKKKMLSNQSQKGGEASTNIQANQLVLNVGIDEKRAREICQEMNHQLRKEYTQEALEIAHYRVKEFEKILMPKMAAIEGAMNSFADPSFQLLLIEARKRAAATEREADHDMLSELLVERFEKSSSRTAVAGISLAVEIVDKVSDEALLGLTVFNAAAMYSPSAGKIFDGLETLEGIYSKLICGPLPQGTEWLDHLDILNAVRVNQSGGIKPIAQYYPENLPGYVDVGIKKKSDNYSKAQQIILENALPLNLLIEHELNSDYVRMGLTRPDQEIKILSIHPESKEPFYNLLTSNQKEALKSVWALYSQDPQIRQNNINSFIAEWDKRPNLNRLREWWERIGTGVKITPVGAALASANARRIDPRLPMF